MKFRTILVFGLTAAVVACGGSTSPDEDNENTDSPSGGGTTTGDNTDDGDTTTGANSIGAFDTTGDFVPGAINIATEDLGAGQSSTLSVRLRDGAGNPLTEAIDVFFSSRCTADGQASIEPAVITNASGTVNAVYTTLSCEGTDTVTARTSVNGTTLTATGELQTRAANFGSINFRDLTQEQIGLRGTGALPEQSIVVFEITDSVGGPIPNQNVDFSLNTRVGGIRLSSDSALTDRTGTVSTTVTAGTVATPVRVTATTMGDDGQVLSAQSNLLSITTGLPDDNSFSLSAETLNLEAVQFDGQSTPVTIRAADRFNNPAPDGTAVTFTTEGGSIPGSCTISEGSCTVMFTTQDPYPADGRSTILATAIGEESFADTTPSNGRFDEGEFDRDNDLPEAFVDYNENGRRDSNEPYRDFNNDGSYTLGDNRFTGIRCEESESGTDETRDCATSSVNVRDQLVIVFSASMQTITFSPSAIALDNGNVDVVVRVGGSQGQVPPADTTISATTSLGSIVGPSSYTVMSTAARGPYEARFELEPAADLGTNETGRLDITVTTPEGIISRGRATVTQSSTESTEVAD